ncbi:erythromycin esterase family protein [Jiangella endophytica]|uniref:erythromycin esterase family protein n=1 Tax=Jiangella endophytica TaxID=1623398 RepID=UPI000E34B35F|nr:erythromycin esterase family protein [Jiangella endophytica]
MVRHDKTTMKRRTFLGAVAVAGSALATGLAGGTQTASAGDAVVAALDRHGHRLRSTEPHGDLDDLRPFGRLIGDAVVVGLGEATHNSREFFTMKHRVFRYLVRTRGFRTFSQEVHAAAGLRIDDYVVSGKGDIRQIMREEFQSSTRLWHTQEYLALFEWMRAYNRSHRVKVRYMGNDVDYAGPELFTRVEEHVRARRPALLPRFAELYRGLRPETDMDTWMREYPSRPLAERRVFAARARQAVELLADLGPGADDSHAWAVRHARTIEQVATLWSFDLDDVDELGAALRHRETAMAGNTVWWHERTGHKVLLSAHNFHVAYASIDPDLQPDMQGTFLRQALGTGYVSVGFTFHRGSFNAGPDDQPLQTFTVGPPSPEHHEYVLDQARFRDYVVDLRDAPAVLRDWSRQARPTRSIGADYPVPDHRLALGEFYDVVIHLHRIRAARLLS